MADPIVRVMALLCVLGVSLAAAAAARAQPVAVLPAVGGAADADRKALDAALRKAVGAADGVDLQAASDTKRHVLSMAEMGLVCLPDDVPCLAKLGLAADVALVLVPVAERASGGALAVEIGVIDVAKSASVRAVKGTLTPSATEDVEDLVDKALGRALGKDDPEPKSDPKPKPKPDPRPEPKPDPPVEGAGPSLSTVGFAVAGIGGGVMVLGVAGAAFCELAFAGLVGGFDAPTRAGAIRPAGIALWITSAVGLVGLGSGLVLALVSRPPEAGE